MVRRSIYLVILFFPLLSLAQQTNIYTDVEWRYKSALDLLRKEKFSAAREEFTKALEEPISEAARQDAMYYIGLCAAELYHPDAEFLLTDFISKYPQSINVSFAHFQLGRIYYKQRKYRNAITHFEAVDVAYLKNDEVIEYYFKKGYSYFTRKDYDKAGKSLSQIINVESKYQTAAQYYNAHVEYSRNNNKAALEQFMKLKNSESFGPLVPLYITQIYFDQQKYDEALDYAIPALKAENTQNKTEITRIVAESFYRKGNFAKAITYFEDYTKNIPQTTRQEKYQVGFCYYMLKDYTKAIDYLKQVLNPKDKLAQNAYFHLADCFLKTDDKQGALTAFESASKMSYDPQIQEEAMFNYAKLAVDLNMQSSTIRVMNDFMTKYPKSEHKDEITELLATLYMQTRNYKEALAALDKIKNRTASGNAAYQKVAYYRAVELFNDHDYEQSIRLLNKAITTNIDPLIQAQAIYWKSEALYNQNKFDDAIKEYRIFIFTPAALKLGFYNRSNYDMGYCYYKKGNYKEAATWFRKYIASRGETDNSRYNDALVRIGDAYFMQRDFANAENFYSQAVGSKASSSDYSLFQRGIILGINGNNRAKADAMQQLISTYPKSNYADDAYFERAKALMVLDQDAEAELAYNKLISSFPASPYIKKSLLNKGLIYFNSKNDEKAIETFKQVVTKYPSTPESVEALNQIKNIYVAQGNPNAYFDYVKKIPNNAVSSGAQDSITYEAAEQRYMKGDYKNASNDFALYLSRFPNGTYLLNATFYKAECEYMAKDYVNALKGYETVNSATKNLFTERSLIRSSAIYYTQKNYDQALTAYQRLESNADYADNLLIAQTGSMRSYDKLKNCSQAIVYADKLLSNDKTDPSVISEARLIKARCSMEAKDYAAAAKEFNQIAKGSNSEVVAEAKYTLAFIQYKWGNYKESQKKCFEVIKQVPSYDFWIGKAFILLGDNYIALKDNFQAKQTYQSIIDNYEKNPSDPEDLKQIATEKLNALITTEGVPQPQQPKEEENNEN
ncbi:MAG: tetratricopeptide repeat protein [Bacteroidia bacterium]|jgi:TolA-binding protein